MISVEVRCLRCQIPTYSPLEDDMEYTVLTISYLLGGGDGYDMFKDNIIDMVALSK